MNENNVSEQLAWEGELLQCSECSVPYLNKRKEQAVGLEGLAAAAGKQRQHYLNTQCGHGCECQDSVIESVMESLGYKRHPMASRQSVPVNFQSCGAVWPQVGVKAVALFDKRIGSSGFLSGPKIWPSQSAFRVVTLHHHKIYRE